MGTIVNRPCLEITSLDLIGIFDAANICYQFGLTRQQAEESKRYLIQDGIRELRESPDHLLDYKLNVKGFQVGIWVQKLSRATLISASKRSNAVSGGYIPPEEVKVSEEQARQRESLFRKSLESIFPGEILSS